MRTFTPEMGKHKRKQMDLLEEKNVQNRHTCLNCGMEYEGNYCSRCGQSHTVGRLSLRRVATELLPDIYNLDNKFMRTCVDLFRRPGTMIMDFVDGKRVRYYKPLPLLFVMASVFIIVSQLCNTYTAHPFNPSIYNIGPLRWCQEGSIADHVFRILYRIYWNEAWRTILSVTLLVWPLKWAFRHSPTGSRLNAAEVFFIMLYLNCQSIIIKVVQIPLDALFSRWPITDGLFGDSTVEMASLVLRLWTLMHIFGTNRRRTAWNYLKAHILLYTIIASVVAFVVITAYLLAPAEWQKIIPTTAADSLFLELAD